MVWKAVSVNSLLKSVPVDYYGAVFDSVFCWKQPRICPGNWRGKTPTRCFCPGKNIAGVTAPENIIIAGDTAWAGPLPNIHLPEFHAPAVCLEHAQ